MFLLHLGALLEWMREWCTGFLDSLGGATKQGSVIARGASMPEEKEERKEVAKTTTVRQADCSRDNRPLAIREWWPEDWRFVRIICHGELNDVYEMETIEGFRRAVKLLRPINAAVHEMMRREIAIQSDARRLPEHPNILRTIAVLQLPGLLHGWICVFELAQADLFHWIQSKGIHEHNPLPEKEVRQLWSQMLKAVAHCHRHRIAHRDIKLENFLVFPDGALKLTDFGFACEFPSSSSGEDGLLCTNSGSVHYAAPEVWLQARHPPHSVDVWSLGVSLYVIRLGCMPFAHHSKTEIKRQVLATQQMPLKIPDWASHDDLADLIRLTISYDWTSRSSCQTLHHLMVI